MFERPILIYSNYCKFSNLFIEYLVKYPELYNTFIRINIDVDPNTNERPPVFYDIQKMLQFNITNVPTIIVQNGEFILTGKEAFSWLEYQLNALDQTEERVQEKEESSGVLEAFNPLEMGSFSDGYAGIDNSLPSSQSFQFVNMPIQNIQTPDETGENFDKELIDRNNRDDGNDYSNFMQKRNNLVHTQKYQSTDQMIQPQQFSSKKQNEIDKKYEQMLADRDMSNKKRPPKKVNFATGTFE